MPGRSDLYVTKALSSSKSPNIRVASRKALSLYRDCIKSVPVVKEAYGLEDIPTSQMIKRIRLEFEKNKGLQNPAAVDVLVFKGQTDLEEFLMKWKQKLHVFKYFTQFTENKETGAAAENKERERVARNKWVVEQLQAVEAKLEPVLQKAEKVLPAAEVQFLACQLYKAEYAKLASLMPKLAAEDFPPIEGAFWNQFVSPSYSLDEEW
eukprot:TRINITY_DN3688_c0_g1_i1.p2 TRINITY_DN3688_c0_g1~~TRINITY_DN3688_c0_g1_i1.p2  ORF type:complete len:208 (-),score=72.75 TRINITY_DN3688_c0_g1_i1:292-915(-)